MIGIELDNEQWMKHVRYERGYRFSYTSTYPICGCLLKKISRSGRLHLRNLFLPPEGVPSRKLSDHRIEKGDRREVLSDAREPEVDIPEQWFSPNFQLNRLNNS